jgi:hypothetical protein
MRAILFEHFNSAKVCKSAVRRKLHLRTDGLTEIKYCLLAGALQKPNMANIF